MLPELLISKLRILYLHSRRRYLINSIPLLSIVALLIGICISCINTNYTYATTFGNSTASITLDTSDVVVNVVPGETGYASKSITVSTNNTESYALTITAPAVLKNESTNSTNPWSYAYGQSGELSTMSYTNFDGNTKELESGIESNGSTKTLAFSSTFAEGLASGHYKAEVILGLTAAPKAALGMWTLADGSTKSSGITTMQEMTPEICNQVDAPVAVATPGGTNAPTMKLKDTRDDNIYSIAKFPDGRCWMQEDLRLKLSTATTLTKQDTDVDSFTPSANTIIGASSLQTGDSPDFNQEADYYRVQSFAASEEPEFVYYSWTAATAGTGTASVAIGDAPGSVCPKGWKIPSGGDNGSNSEIEIFTAKAKIPTYYTSENATDRKLGQEIIQASPYNFINNGIVFDGRYEDYASIIGHHAWWWTRTAYSATNTWNLGISSGFIYPGAGSANKRSRGFAVRCIAEEAKPKFTIVYEPGESRKYTEASKTEFASTYTTQTSPIDYTGSSYTFTTHSTALSMRETNSCSQTIGGWGLSDGGSTTAYSLGGQVTLTESNPTLTLYPTYTGWHECTSG